MSQFITRIPVNLDAVKKLLPKRSDLQSVTLSEDGQNVEVIWSNDDMHSGRTFAFEWPMANLERKKCPNGVVNRAPLPKPLQKVQTTLDSHKGEDKVAA